MLDVCLKRVNESGLHASADDRRLRSHCEIVRGKEVNLKKFAFYKVELHT